MDFARHLKKGNTLALVEDEVLVDEGWLCGQAFITGTQLLLQRILNTNIENIPFELN